MIGELQSLRFIFHVARDKSIASKAHFLVPPPKKRPLSAEELACLESKGAFCLESEELRLELLDLFFDYIYPILPIVDPHDFFRRYDAGGAESISPLLLQSMFLTASSVSHRPFLLTGYQVGMLMTLANPSLYRSRDSDARGCHHSWP